MFHESRWAWVIVLLSALCLAPGSMAEEEKKAPMSKEEAVRAALAHPISFNFGETPLQDVLDYVHDFILEKVGTGIDVVTDTAALEEVGVDLHNTPISIRLNEIPLEKALALVLRPLDLSAIPNNDVLLITSEQGALDRLTVKVYPVHDLVLLGQERSELAILGPTLVKTIEKVVTPSSWGDEGGAGQVIFDPLTISLIVTQTYANHREIDALLAKLRDAKRELQGVAKTDGYPSLGQLEAAQVAAAKAEGEQAPKKTTAVSKAKSPQATSLGKAFSQMFSIKTE